MNYLIPPFHKGNGLDGEELILFMTELVLQYDIIITQNTDLHVISVEHINEGDFIEEYYIVTTKVIHYMFNDTFTIKDYNDLQVYRVIASILK